LEKKVVLHAYEVNDTGKLVVTEGYYFLIFVWPAFLLNYFSFDPVYTVYTKRNFVIGLITEQAVLQAGCPCNVGKDQKRVTMKMSLKAKVENKKHKLTLYRQRLGSYLAFK